MQPTQPEKFKETLSRCLVFFRQTLTNLADGGVMLLDLETVDYVMQLIDLLDADLLIEGFIKRSYKYWEKIKNRDEDFFVKNSATLFPGLPEDVASSLTALFTQNHLHKKDKDELWKNVVIMVRVSIVHIYMKGTQASYPNLQSYVDWADLHQRIAPFLPDRQA